MKHLLCMASIALWAISSSASQQSPEYKRGDCIFSDDPSYSWHGRYAFVEAFTSVDEVSDIEVYILAFPFNGSNSAIFSQEIELHTKKVSDAFCKTSRPLNELPGSAPAGG